jgi:hypothetical protein
MFSCLHQKKQKKSLTELLDSLKKFKDLHEILVEITNNQYIDTLSPLEKVEKIKKYNKILIELEEKKMFDYTVFVTIQEIMKLVD